MNLKKTSFLNCAVFVFVTAVLFGDRLDASFLPDESELSSISTWDRSVFAPSSANAERPVKQSEKKEDDEKEVVTAYGSWRAKHYRSTKIDSECKRRQPFFARRYRRFKQHNDLYRSGRLSFDVNLNHLADKTEDEIRQKYQPRGLILSKDEAEDDIPEALDAPSGIEMLDDNDVPDGCPSELDWRTKRPECVQSVVTQQTCANCYAFGGTACLEWHYCLITGEAIKFSEQQATDCTAGDPYYNKGCSGGKLYTIFQYAAEYYYFCANRTYPFTFKSDPKQCYADRCEDYREMWPLIDPYYRRIAKYDVAAIMKILCKVGPVAVELATKPDFDYYKTGVYSGETDPKNQCSIEDRDHVVLLIGYGTDKVTKKKYWLVRNSWGEKWGDQGHVKIERGKNICGCEMAARYPLMSPHSQSRK